MSKKTIKLIILLSVLTCPAISYGQYIVHYTERNDVKNDTLVDSSGVKFILDKERMYVTAIDKNGKQLWKTDPAVDNKLKEYRIKRPHIVYFDFSIKYVKSTEGFEKEQVIVVGYENSQAGYLIRKTGTFHFEGQD